MRADGNEPGRAYEDLTPSLVAELRAGGDRAASLLDELYRGALVRFCRGYLGVEEEAQDAVQEVFCKVIASNTVPDNFRAWLYRIARNHCLNIRRHWARRGSPELLPSDSKLIAELTGQSTRLARKELQARVQHLLATLSEASREVVLLRYVTGFSRAEIAEVLELPESVVKSRLFEGLKKLRAEAATLDGWSGQ